MGRMHAVDGITYAREYELRQRVEKLERLLADADAALDWVMSLGLDIPDQFIIDQALRRHAARQKP